MAVTKKSNNLLCKLIITVDCNVQGIQEIPASLSFDVYDNGNVSEAFKKDLTSKRNLHFKGKAAVERIASIRENQCEIDDDNNLIPDLLLTPQQEAEKIANIAFPDKQRDLTDRLEYANLKFNDILICYTVNS